MKQVALLLLILLRALPGHAQPPVDTLQLRLHKLGYVLTSESKAGPPYTAYQLNADGGLTVHQKMPVYYLDGAGRPLPGGPYQYGSGDFRGGRAIVYKDEREGVINRQGKVIIPLLYTSLGRIRHPQHWLAAQHQGRWGLIDSVGREVVPPRYEAVERYSEGLLAVKRDGKWGFLNEAGQEVIPPLYERVHRGFSGGFAFVQRAGGQVLEDYGFINRRGQAITPFEYEIPFCSIAHFSSLTTFNQFSRGFAIVGNQKCQKGAIDTTGRLVLPIRFDYITRTDSTLEGHYRRKKTVVYRLPR